MNIKKHLRSPEAMVGEVTQGYDIVKTRNGHYAVTIRSGSRKARVIAPALRVTGDRC